MPSKYAEIVVIMQRRIDDGLYAVGALIPSESQLSTEFCTSRSTVVRALRYLRRRGWLHGVQGKGRIVLGRPSADLTTLPERLRYLLQAERNMALLGIRQVSASRRIATALERQTGASLCARRYLFARPGPGEKAFGMGVAYLPAAFAEVPRRPEGGLLPGVEKWTGIAATRVIERIGARLATDAEVRALALPQTRSVAVSLVTVRDSEDVPFLVVDAIFARESQEMVSRYDL